MASWQEVVDFKYDAKNQTYCLVLIISCHLSGKVLSASKVAKLVMCEKLVRMIRLNSGSIIGLVILV